MKTEMITSPKIIWSFQKQKKTNDAEIRFAEKCRKCGLPQKLQILFCCIRSYNWNIWWKSKSSPPCHFPSFEQGKIALWKVSPQSTRRCDSVNENDFLGVWPDLSFAEHTVLTIQIHAQLVKVNLSQLLCSRRWWWCGCFSAFCKNIRFHERSVSNLKSLRFTFRLGCGCGWIGWKLMKGNEVHENEWKWTKVDEIIYKRPVSDLKSPRFTFGLGFG